MDRNWSIPPERMAAINADMKRTVDSFKLPTPKPLPPPDPRFKHGPSELCQLAVMAKVLTLGPDWVMEEKHDGVRLLWKAGTLLTREGEPAPFAEHLRADFERFERRAGRRMVIDCEYVEAGGFQATLAAVRRGEGTGPAYVFDALPLEDWERGEGAVLLVRRHFLNSVFSGWAPDGLRLVEQWPAFNAAVVEAKARKIWERGGEGLMLKNRQALYVRGRSAAWQKIKRKVRLEAVVVDSVPDKAVVIVEVGGTRHRIGSQTPLPVGERVTVEAMEWTDKGRLRQPRIVGEA